MQFLRLDHDAQWQLLPLHELWQHERLQLIFSVVILREALFAERRTLGEPRDASRFVRGINRALARIQICRKQLLSASS